MNQEAIDVHIREIAYHLVEGLSENEIIEMYSFSGVNMADISLLLAAGKILYNDRKNAKPVKGSFKRVI